VKHLLFIRTAIIRYWRHDFSLHFDISCTTYLPGLELLDGHGCTRVLTMYLFMVQLHVRDGTES